MAVIEKDLGNIVGQNLDIKPNTYIKTGNKINGKTEYIMLKIITPDNNTDSGNSIDFIRISDCPYIDYGNSFVILRNEPGITALQPLYAYEIEVDGVRAYIGKVANAWRLYYDIKITYDYEIYVFIKFLR